VENDFKDITILKVYQN